MEKFINTEYLKNVREKKGYSHRYMSGQLGAKSSATYYNIEIGKVDPKISQLIKISKILQIPIKKILKLKFN